MTDLDPVARTARALLEAARGDAVVRAADALAPAGRESSGALAG